MSLGAIGCAGTVTKPERWGPFVLPATAPGPVVDTYHGRDVADPYRWLEELDSPATRAFIVAQNDVTGSVLGRITERATIADRLEALWSYDAWGVPVVRGERAFFTLKEGLANQPVLWVARADLSEAKPLVDPNQLSADGTVALTAWQPSEDGRWLAYATSDAGSDWRTVFVIDVETGAQQSDRVDWVKFSGISWAPDSSGFYYGRYPEPSAEGAFSDVNRNQRICWHRLGTPQDQDVVVFERPEDPELGAHAGVSEDGRWILLHLSRGTDPESAVALVPRAEDGSAAGPAVELPGGFEASHWPIALVGSTLWVLTDRDAPRQRIITLNLDAPAPANWTTIVPEGPHRIENARLVGGRLVVIRLANAANQVHTYALDGSDEREVALPSLGTAAGLTARRHQHSDFLSFESFTHVPAVYRLDVAASRLEPVFEAKLPVVPSDYVVDQRFYSSRDGTQIPMFIARHRRTKLNGTAPALLYGYGGFDISLTPIFSPSRLVFMQMGGIFAMPNLRGGGEFGREWHEAGTKARKQNAFDDYIAAAEFLHREGYTQPSRTAISGRSNGGLLVGAVLAQRPELFGAALPGVGVLDMLRFHRFTIGWAWVGEYGSADNAEEFPFLFAYSPLHNLKAGAQYPATLITTGDHDDRVVPSHSYKFAAALQAAQGGTEPILIRIDTSAGHGAGKPTRKRIEEQADEWAFLLRALDFSLPADF